MLQLTRHSSLFLFFFFHLQYQTLDTGIRKYEFILPLFGIKTPLSTCESCPKCKEKCSPFMSSVLEEKFSFHIIIFAKNKQSQRFQNPIFGVECDHKQHSIYRSQKRHKECCEKIAKCSQFSESFQIHCWSWTNMLS